MIRTLTPVLMAALGAMTATDAISPRLAPEAPPVITVHAKDFAFTLPKSIKSGPTTFHLVNDGKALHHLSVIKLAKGKTMADLVAFMKKPAPPFGWFTEAGGPNPATPGGSADATLTLEPGEYVVACFIPSPGDPAPHIMKGMISPLTVTAEKNGATAPTTDITIRTTDYAFFVSKPITTGHHVIAVQNDAAQAHEIIILELAPGKTLADFNKWAGPDLMKGPPPGRPLNGMSGVAKGRTASFPVDFTPGTYGFICLAPDAKDGKPHADHGMMQAFTVK